MHSPSMEAAESDASAARAAAPPSPSQDKTVELSMPQLAALRRMQSPVKHTGKDATRPANLAPPRLPSPNMVSSFSPLISIIADSSLEVTPLERHTSQAATPAAALALLRGERHIASPRPRRPLQATTTTTTPTSSSSPSSPAAAAATSTLATPTTRSQQGSPRVGGAGVALDDEHVTRGVDLQDKAVADVVPSQARRVATGTTATTGAGTTTVSPPRVRASTPCAHTQTRPFTDSPTFAQHRLALLGRSPMPSDLISVTRTLASCSPRSTTTVSSQDHRTRLREGRRTTATNTAIFPLHTPSTATAAPHTARQATTATTTNTTATTNNNTNTTASRVTDPIVSSLLPLHAQARWVYGHHFPLYTEGTATSARVGRDTTSSHHHHHHHHHHRLVTPAGNTRNEDSEPRKTNHKAGAAAATALNRPDLRRTGGDFLLDRTRASFLIGCQKEEDMHHAGCLPHHLRDGSPTTLRLRGQSLDEVSAACRAAIDLRLHRASRPRVGEGAKDKTAAEATGSQPYIPGHQMANSPPRSDSAGSKKEASYVVLQRAMCAAAADAVRASRSDSDMLLSVGYITLPETELPGQLSWLPPHHFYEDNNAVVNDPTVPIHLPSVAAAVTSATTTKATPEDVAGRQTPNVIDSHTLSPVQQPVGPTSVPSPSHLPPLGGPCALEHARLLHLLSRAGAHLPLARAVAATANPHDTTTSNTGHTLGSAAAGVVGSGAERHEEGRLTHNSSRSASHNHQHVRHGSPPSLAESSTTSNHAMARSHLEAHVEPSHATCNASDVASVAESVARSMHRSASAASNTSLVDSLPASHKSSRSHRGGSTPSPHAAHLPGERGNIAAGGSNTVRTLRQQAPRTAAIRRETNGEDCMPSLGHLLTSFDTTTSVDGTPGVLQGLGLFTAMPLDAQIQYSHSDDVPEGVSLHGVVSASRPRRHRLLSNTHTSHHDGGDRSAHGTAQEQQQRAPGNIYTLTAAERGHVAPTPLFSHLMHASSSAAPPEQSQQQVTPSLCQLLDIPGLT